MVCTGTAAAGLVGTPAHPGMAHATTPVTNSVCQSVLVILLLMMK